MTGKNVAVAKSNLPAHLQGKISPQVSKEFSGGVTAGFPVISYRGKVWRVKKSGEEQVYLSEDGDAVQSIEVVLIKSNERLSKTYYKGKYSEGDQEKPQCWSSDGVRPDNDVPNKVNAMCDSCPMNAWGSKITDEGKKAKACQDVRRCAVIFSHELEDVVAGEKALDDADVMLLRIPPATLSPLKDYAERILAPKGATPYMLITKISFDTDASFPKLLFKGARWLSEDEFGAVEELRDSEAVKRILSTSAEHAAGGTTDEEDEASSSDHAANEEASESAPSGVVAEELAFDDDDDDDDEIAPAPKRAAAIEEDAADEIEQPPKPKAKKKAKAKKPSKPKAPEVESPDEGDEDIDAMLSSILD